MTFAKLLSALLLSLSMIQVSSASVIDSADVNGLKTFQDTATGRVWLDLNNFYDIASNNSLTGTQMIAAAQVAGFTFATKSDVTELLSTLPLGAGQWNAYAPVTGYGVPRELIWGVYDDGDANSLFGWAYAFSSDTNWAYQDNIANPSVVVNSGNPGSVDLGIFAYIEGSNSVPEPESIALIGLGLAGLLAARRRKARA